MTQGSSQSTENLGDWLNKFSAPILGFISLVVEIVAFIQLWRGDNATVTWVSAGLGIILTISALLFIGYKTEPGKIQVKGRREYRVPKYPKYYKQARYALYILLTISIFAGCLLYWQIQIRRDKIVILVANFDAPNTAAYSITEQIIFNLNENLGAYNDVIIEPLGKSISELEGKKRARAIGERYQADILIWGWYSVTNNSALVTIHIENFIVNSKVFSLQSSNAYQSLVPLSEIEGFTIQEKTGSEISAFTLLTSGLARYLAKDYPEAIKRFNAASQIGEWPDPIDKASVFFYQGNSYLHLEQYEQALISYGQSLQLKPDCDICYNNLGITNFKLGRYEEAIGDFNNAIAINDQDAFAFIGRSLAYHSSDPNNPIFIEHALADLQKAIDINKHSPIPYTLQCVIYVGKEDSKNALISSNLAIHEDRKYAIAYTCRGVAYGMMGDLKKAKADFDKALSLEPTDAMVEAVRLSYQILGIKP